ncbi:MAG TPA: tetratricopeptide repeat protein [Burkholderiaceae bacterium]|jgi:tetratricopeptide (TPR) repeat protein|nr:tetratricopeptide repeat protein [Burkholderiaceae bacterium]
MRHWASLLLCLGLAACASAPPLAPHEPLFHDQLFAPPTQPIRAADVFALSEDMRRYVRDEIATHARSHGRQRALIDALYKRGQLKLEYDAAMTRNAAQAFDARAGNCLSLVIMTAAFAKELGLQIHYQSAYTDEMWSRSGGLLFRSGHVNVTLGSRFIDAGSGEDTTRYTIDFLPPDELRGLRTQSISEDTVVAMYMNNRAAEALAEERLDNAYWWARAAIARSPDFISPYNTLGVIYQRHGDWPLAEQVYGRVLEREPTNTRALANLAQLAEQRGNIAQAQALRQQLARLEPYPPFHFFNLGRAAMQRGDYVAARDLFAKEVARADYYHEFHFWLGLAHYRLGEMELARKELNLAMQNSTTRGDRDLYAAKLAWLRNH